MELGALKGPAELLASRVKAFKNCLELATECLTNKDYFNAEIIYGGILSDIHKDCIIEALNLNDLELFSLHSCFAYSSIGADYKSEQALVILNSIHKPIKLPLVPYLKAFIHISNDRISFAHDELQFCQTLLNDGYNFKPNSILNEDIVPEINDEFLKLKLNGLRFVCELLKAKEDNEELKKCFREHWLKIGKLCETDFAKWKKNKTEELPKGTVVVEKRGKNVTTNQTGAIKKVEKQTQKNKTESIASQTQLPKGISVAVQTVEKEVNQQLLATVIDIRNKMNNLQNKKDNEIKQLQKKNNELNDKLMAKETKRQEKNNEFEFLKDQFLAMEKKWEQSQKQVELLQKLLVEHMQQKYQMQKNIYQLFEEKCDYKLVYLSDLQKYLSPTDSVPSPDECKQEVAVWQNTLNKISGAKKNFETFYRTIDELVVAKKYVSIKMGDWPGIPHIPNDIQDVIHRNLKLIIQQSKSLYSVPFTNQYSGIFGNYGNYYKDNNFPSPNCFVNSYNAYKEDGRTTGSPPVYAKISPPVTITRQQYYQPSPQHQYHPPPQQVHPPPQQVHPPPKQVHPPPKQVHPPSPIQQRPNNKKLEISPPSPVSSEPPNVYQSEQELLKFLQSNFEGIAEIELLETIYQIRDQNGGTLINYPKKLLLSEIKKKLKRNKVVKSGWNNMSHTQWHNDHTENRCCICFEDYDATSVHSLPCQHEFHKTCITNWLKRQSACPVCRVHAVIDEEYPPLKA